MVCEECGEQGLDPEVGICPKCGPVRMMCLDDWNMWKAGLLLHYGEEPEDPEES